VGDAPAYGVAEDREVAANASSVRGGQELPDPADSASSASEKQEPPEEAPPAEPWFGDLDDEDLPPEVQHDQEQDQEKAPPPPSAPPAPAARPTVKSSAPELRLSSKLRITAAAIGEFVDTTQGAFAADDERRRRELNEALGREDAGVRRYQRTCASCERAFVSRDLLRETCGYLCQLKLTRRRARAEAKATTPTEEASP
jgi:hypothetical protein